MRVDFGTAVPILKFQMRTILTNEFILKRITFVNKVILLTYILFLCGVACIVASIVEFQFFSKNVNPVVKLPKGLHKRNH
jgi:hypothetical protein